MVVMCWGNSPRGFIARSIRASIQLKTKRHSSPLGLKQGRCVSRSIAGARRRAFGCRSSQPTHHLDQKTLLGPGIRTLPQFSHLIWALRPQESSQQNQDRFNPFIVPLVRRDHARCRPAQGRVQPSIHNSSASSRLVTCSSQHCT